MSLKFWKWKKKVKKVHKDHVNNLIKLNNPKSTNKQKLKAQANLESLEVDEFALEDYYNTFKKSKKTIDVNSKISLKNRIKDNRPYGRFDDAGNDLFKLGKNPMRNVRTYYSYRKK